MNINTLSSKNIYIGPTIGLGYKNSGAHCERIKIGDTQEVAVKCITRFIFFYKLIDTFRSIVGNQKRFKTITIASSNGKTKNILINIKSLLSRTFLTKNQIQSLSTKELSLLLSSRITDAIHPKKLSRLFPNSILISLKDKQERRDSLNTHLKSIGQSLNFHHLEAVYGKNLPQELQIKMSNSSSAIKENREDYKGRMGCFMSQLNAVKLAKEKQYPFVLICEDDVRFMPDKVCSSYLEKGLKELPKDWEICFLGYYEADKKNVKNFSDHLVMPSVPYDNHAYLVNACMYDKLIETYENELKKNNHQMRACDVVLAEELTRGCKTFAFKENVAHLK